MGDKEVKTNPYDYAYATGRVRALETKLMTQAQTSRLFESKTIDDATRVLLDSGYIITDSIEACVQNNLIESYDVMSSIIPNPEYLDALLLLHDYHNIKVIIKSFIHYSPSRKTVSLSKEEEKEIGSENDVTFFFESNENNVLFKDIIHIMAFPSKVDPAKLFETIRDQRINELDESFRFTIKRALQEYIHTSDSGVIDTVVDQQYFKILHEIAETMKNPFFKSYCDFRADSVNLEILLRIRALKASAAQMSRSLVQGGSVSKEKIEELYNASNDEIIAAFANTSCKRLAEFSSEYGSGVTTAQFGKTSDNLLIELIRKAKTILFGPEIIIAFLVAKEIQVKNINIVLTCLRNQIPMSLAREMMRETY